MFDRTPLREGTRFHGFMLSRTDGPKGSSSPAPKIDSSTLGYNLKAAIQKDGKARCRKLASVQVYTGGGG